MSAVTSVKSAGGGGFLFEDLVGAYVAAAMLSQNPVIGGLDPPVRICFQVGILGWVLDDMLVSFPGKGKATRRWAVSIRDRQAEFKGGPSGEFVKKAWREVLGCTSSGFNPGRDYVGVVIPPLHRDTKSDLEELLKLAEEQNAEKPESRIDHGEPVSGSKRRLWERFRKPGNSHQLPASPDYLLQRFKYLDLDLNQVNSLDRDKAVGFCQEALASDGGGEHLWDSLLAETARVRTRGGYLDRAKLIERLEDRKDKFDFRDDKRTDPVYIEQMRRSSRARMIERWCAVGLPEEAAEQMAENPSVGRLGGEVPDEGVVVLTGDFGSGKSLAAERVHLEDVTAYAVNNDEAIPVFLRARRAMEGLEESLRRALPSRSDVFGRSFRLILDGLDEVGGSLRAELLEEARVLARSRPGTRVLITARPGLRLRKDERLPMAELSDEALADLSERLGHDRHALSRVPDPVKDAIRYPLFAIIALRLLAKGAGLPSSRALFLDRFVKDALQPRKDDIMSSLDTLAKVAALSMPRSGVLREHDLEPDAVEGLLATRMIVRDGNVFRFALPVFEQYFGAYALLREHIPVAEVLRDLRAFESWRYAFVIAVGIGSWEKISDLVEALGHRWPGAACWVINQAVSKRTRLMNFEDGRPSSFLTTNPPPPPRFPTRRYEEWLPDSLECARRLRRAFSAMTGWLEKIAPFAGLVDNTGRLPAIGVWSRGGVVSAGYGFGEALPSSGAFALDHPGDVDVTPNSFAILTEGPPPLDENGWPWRWVLRWVACAIESILKDKRLPLPPDGPLRAEYDWDIARALVGDLGRGYSVDAQHVIEKGQRMLSYGDHDPLSSFSFGGKTLEYQELFRFVSEAKKHENDPYVQPWPSPDNPPEEWGSSGLYSKEAMRELIKSRYMAALAAYDHISRTWFPKWVPTMGWGAAMPIRLDLILSPPGPMHLVGRGGPYGLELKETVVETDEGLGVTVDLASDENSSTTWEEHWEKHGKDYTSRMKQLRSLHPQTAEWARLTFHSIQLLHPPSGTPATNLVYEWIWRDLHEIGLLSSRRSFD